MSLTPSIFTGLYPKRGDITGNFEQAFGKVSTLNAYIIGGISSKSVAAIGIIAWGMYTLQYLFAPQVNCDLGGTPIAIIGNVSNTMGEFSCITLPLSSFKFFYCIASKTTVDGVLPYGTELSYDLLSNTDWQGSPTEKVGLLVPNFHFIYFGQKVTTFWEHHF